MTEIIISTDITGDPSNGVTVDFAGENVNLVSMLVIGIMECEDLAIMLSDAIEIMTNIKKERLN